MLSQKPDENAPLLKSVYFGGTLPKSGSRTALLFWGASSVVSAGATAAGLTELLTTSAAFARAFAGIVGVIGAAGFVLATACFANELSTKCIADPKPPEESLNL